MSDAAAGAGAGDERTMMKAAILQKNGDPSTPEVVRLDEKVPIPQPSRGELLIKVHAAAINPVDWKFARGFVPGKKSGPLGCDVAGVVDKIGPDTVTDLRVGDAIYADAVDTMGSFAEYVIVKAKVASKKPSNASFAEAASLPLAGLTALQGWQRYGLLKEGQKVLVLGGSGGVGSLAIQMAKALGASEVYSTGSNVELIKGFGADEVINYKEQSLMDALKGKDFDIVYDTIGGLDHWQVAQACMKKGGRFITIVGDDGESMVANLAKAAWRAIQGKIGLGFSYSIFLTNTRYDGIAKDMTTMTEMVESGKLKPVLDEHRFEFTQEGIGELFKTSMSHRAKGKLILQVIKE